MQDDGLKAALVRMAELQERTITGHDDVTRLSHVSQTLNRLTNIVDERLPAPAASPGTSSAMDIVSS